MPPRRRRALAPHHAAAARVTALRIQNEQERLQHPEVQQAPGTAALHPQRSARGLPRGDPVDAQARKRTVNTRAAPKTIKARPHTSKTLCIPSTDAAAALWAAARSASTTVVSPLSAASCSADFPNCARRASPVTIIRAGTHHTEPQRTPSPPHVTRGNCARGGHSHARPHTTHAHTPARHRRAPAAAFAKRTPRAQTLSSPSQDVTESFRVRVRVRLGLGLG
jgi:hypothetical protein